MWFMSGLKRLLSAVMIMLVLLAGCSSGGDSVRKSSEGTIVTEDMLVSRETTYRTAEVKQGSLTRTASTEVSSVYTQTIQLNTGAKELTFKEAFVKRGVSVREGDVLAVLTGRGKPSDAEQAQLDLDYARAAYLETCALHEEAIAKAESGIYLSEEIRRLTVDKLEAAYALYRLNTQATLEAMEQKLVEAQADLGETYIYAPCDGVVKSAASFSEGDLVPAGTALITINRGASLVLYTDTANTAVFSYNTKVTVKWEKGDEPMQGTGRVVCSSDVLPGYVGKYVYILQDSPEELKTAYDPQAEALKLVMNTAVFAPRAALTMEEGRVYVTVLDGSATKKRYVIRGPMAGTDVALLQGVSPGDLVITSQYTS